MTFPNFKAVLLEFVEGLGKKLLFIVVFSQRVKSNVVTYFYSSDTYFILDLGSCECEVEFWVGDDIRNCPLKYLLDYKPTLFKFETSLQLKLLLEHSKARAGFYIKRMVPEVWLYI